MSIITSEQMRALIAQRCAGRRRSEFARELGVTAGYLWQLEHGLREPSEAVARALGYEREKLPVTYVYRRSQKCSQNGERLGGGA